MFRVIRAWWHRQKGPIGDPQDTPMTERRAISMLDRLRGDELPCENYIDHIMLRFLIENGHRKLGRTWCSAKERDAFVEWEQKRSPPTDDVLGRETEGHMTIDAAQRAMITEWHRKEFSKWAKANGIAEQCGMTDDELLESVEFTIREPVKAKDCTCHERDSSYVCDYCYEQGYRGHMQQGGRPKG